MSRIFCTWIILGFLLGSVSSALALPSGLEALVREGLANNPELRAAEARWQMAEQKAPQVGSLDDPQFSFSFTNYPVDSLSGGQAPMTGNDLRLSQRFPFPGKLDSKAESARQQARWQEGVWRDGRLQLAQKISDGWYRLYALDRTAMVLRENIAVLDNMAQLAENRYAVGKALQQDVLKLRVEQTRLEDRLALTTQQRASIKARIDGLLGRSGTTEPIKVPDRLTLTEVAPLQQLLAQAPAHRPLFNAYDALLASYRAQERLAQKNYWPDLTAFVGYRFRQEVPGKDDGTDFVSAGISVNLPVWQRPREAALKQAVLGQTMTREQRQQFLTELQARLTDNYQQLERSQRQLELYRTGVLPQAQQAYEAALSGYGVGKVSVLDVLDSLRMLYGYRIDEARYRADHERAAVQLLALAGTLLPEKENF